MWRNRIKKEEARLEGKVLPYVRSTLLSDGSEAEPKPPPPVAGSSLLSDCSRASGFASAGSTAAPTAKSKSAISVARSKGSHVTAARSTAGSSISGLPSTIRSSEPSGIARNKLAELQLKLELERVLRLERENELEQQRRINLQLKSKYEKEKASAGGE